MRRETICLSSIELSIVPVSKTSFQLSTFAFPERAGLNTSRERPFRRYGIRKGSDTWSGTILSTFPAAVMRTSSFRLIGCYNESADQGVLRGAGGMSSCSRGTAPSDGGAGF